MVNFRRQIGCIYLLETVGSVKNLIRGAKLYNSYQFSRLFIINLLNSILYNPSYL
jgi:hypothetical protein